MIDQSTRRKLLLEPEPPEPVDKSRRNVWMGGETHVLVPTNRSVHLFSSSTMTGKAPSVSWSLSRSWPGLRSEP